MRTEDIRFAIKLTGQEKWGVTRKALQRLMHLNPRGCFIALDGSERVGLTTTSTYGKRLAWIGNVIVDKNHRGKHIGQSIVEHAVGFLHESSIEYIALYCFNEHRKFYEDLGFVKDTSFMRLRRNSSRTKEHEEVEFPQSPPLDRIAATDRRAFGADRSKLIRITLKEKEGWCVGSPRNESSNSYLMVREARDDCEFGPWICTNPEHDRPEDMLLRALALTKPVPIEASCLRENRRSLQIFKANNFRVIREGNRMFFERRAQIGNDKWQFALGFLDKG